MYQFNAFTIQKLCMIQFLVTTGVIESFRCKECLFTNFFARCHPLFMALIIVDKKIGTTKMH